jgi:hypothetical protein
MRRKPHSEKKYSKVDMEWWRADRERIWRGIFLRIIKNMNAAFGKLL